jgi:hypothetical protein
VRPAPKVSGDTGWPEQDFAPAPLPPRPGAAPRRPFNEEGRASPPAPKPASEPAEAQGEESVPPAPAEAAPQEPARPAPRGGPEGTDAKPAPQRSLYDSLEQEMASLLNRPPKP